ncbi:MAG: hypothetical protein ABI852_21070, partial [Gemmatimonadaceae bacterium]
RGGMLILEHPGVVTSNGVRSEQTVTNFQSPLSEGIINPKYAMVSIQLMRWALKRCPYANVVGMGNIENPLPRLLKAAGWTVRPVPFFFNLLRPARCIAELQPLRAKPMVRTVGLIGAYTGMAGLALKFVQRARGASTDGYRSALAIAPGAIDDAIWEDVEQRVSFGVVRNSETLPQYLAPEIERHHVYHGANICGWFSLVIAQNRNHSYFGNLRVATLVDIVASKADDSAVVARLAIVAARAAGCDIVVSNQMSDETQNALRTSGFISYRSNYLFASSKALSEAMSDATGFVSRQDGDGLVNLRGPK